MKLNEVLTEAVSFGGMQKKVYDFVIKKMKMKSSTEDYVRDLAHSSDTFWVSEFDGLLRELEKVRSMSHIEDSLWNVIVGVNEVIVDYMSTAANHPPGYKVQTLKILSDSDVSLKEMVSLINDIDAAVAVKLKKMADDEKAEKIAKAAKAKASAAENFDEIVATYKKHAVKGWRELLKDTKKIKTEREWSVVFGVGSYEAFTAAEITTIEDLKKYVKSFGDKEYVATIVDNMYNIVGLPKEDSLVFNHLHAIKNDNALRKKFLSLVE